MAQLTPTRVKYDALLTLGNADAAGDVYPASERVFVLVKNNDASSVTVTIPQKRPDDLGGTHDIVVSVGAGDLALIHAPPFWYADSNGLITINYGTFTSFKVGVFELG